MNINFIDPEFPPLDYSICPKDFPLSVRGGPFDVPI